MSATDTDAALYDAQETTNPNNVQALQIDKGTGYIVGKMTALYSSLASATAGAVGDTISFFRLPPGTVIVGGWLYVENGAGADDNDTADLGVVYEAGDGTDDPDCLMDGIDIYDGAAAHMQAGLPTGMFWSVPQDIAAMPYEVSGGIGTVQLITKTDAIVTAKDVHLCLYVILPGF